MRVGQILLVLCTFSNSGLCLGYFEYYIVNIFEHYWSALTFSGKMYLFCCCSSRQSTQPKLGSTSSVSLPVSGGSNVSFQSLCYAVWVCQYMYYSGLSLGLEWWFNAASVSKLLLCFFGPVPHTCSLELSSGLVFVSKVGDSLLQLSPLWDSPLYSLAPRGPFSQFPWSK